ncbi:hypothetical protein EB796_013271 [Bugula neritina]|uniref:THAP-type domain-containing protein n=1 Tax=Bugula neritina TaxID=10212 RepID=A0A7J7JQ05_BUGNE|nr:hypothetical protein EB796_013271 [Bugula neritina]
MKCDNGLMVCILKPVFICRASSSKKNIYRCCAANCEGTDHLYRFPKDLVLRSAWVRFIKTRLKSFTAPSTKTALCFRHLTTESFSNYGQYVMTKGTENSVRLVLAPGAIPSIHLDPSMQEKIVSPSKQVDSTPVSAKNRRKLIREALNEPFAKVPRKEPSATRRRHPKVKPSMDFTIGTNLGLHKGTQVKMRKKRPKFRSAQTQTDPKITNIYVESPAPAEETTIEPLPSQSVPAMMLEEPLNEAVQSVADSLDDSDDDYDFSSESDNDEWLPEEEEVEYTAEMQANEEQFFMG